MIFQYLPAGLETSKKASYNVFVLDLPGPKKLTPFQTVTMQSIISMLGENCRQVVNCKELLCTRNFM